MNIWWRESFHQFDVFLTSYELKYVRLISITLTIKARRWRRNKFKVPPWSNLCNPLLPQYPQTIPVNINSPSSWNTLDFQSSHPLNHQMILSTPQEIASPWFKESKMLNQKREQRNQITHLLNINSPLIMIPNSRSPTSQLAFIPSLHLTPSHSTTPSHVFNSFLSPSPLPHQTHPQNKNKNKR